MEIEVEHHDDGTLVVVAGGGPILVFKEDEWPDEWCELPARGTMKSPFLLLAEIEE